MVSPQAALQTDQLQKQKRGGKFPRWILIVASILALLFFIGGAVFWIWKVWGDLSSTPGAIFIALGTIFGFIVLVIAIPPFFQYLRDRRASSPTSTTPATDNNQGDSAQLPLKSTEPLIRLRESASHKKAVVFIHGIGAKDPKEYWRQFTNVLLQDTDAFIKDFDVYAWGYPTHRGPKRLINFTRFLFTGRLTNAAPGIVRLGGLWRSTYHTQFSEYQDTVLVCHSMGGLVVKSYIIDVLAEGQSSKLETLRHITFYATPHSGAPIAGVALNDQLKGMTITGEFVERIRRSWYDHVVKWKDSRIGPGDRSYNRYVPHLVLYGIIDQVVPPNFAEISGMPCEPVPGDHTTIIQPPDTNDTRYRIWRNELEKIFVPSLSNPKGSPDHTVKRDITKPSQNAPFLEWAHYYIMDAKEETEDAHSSLTASYVNPTEYTNKFDSLGEIKKSFEDFHKRIEDTPQLPPEITLSREQLRVNVNRAIGQIEAVRLCIQDWKSPCNHIKGKFNSLLQTLDELGRDCKLKDQ